MPKRASGAIVGVMPPNEPPAGTRRGVSLETWLRGTFHGGSGKHLQRYLNEFAYRIDRRWREGEFFGFVLARALRGRPLPYARPRRANRTGTSALAQLGQIEPFGEGGAEPLHALPRLGA